ncbi:MAG: Asp-tRNA(Asn)/Glu-tRNA(Gln) amidotransferase subunit GatA [candidate division KSB1 bacterium]|nr:Asp-tRNA(Asn)/Glu-tRNA(Gln) amidotransferase subunit GatA [candidate division KSB1 bacterium]
MLTTNASISEIQRRIAAGEISLPELVEFYVRRVESQRSLNAFLDVYADEALEQARKVQGKLAAGKAGPLAGAVLAIKDNIAIKGKKLTCASHILANFVSPYDATVVQRLRTADAIVLGKTNMDEFAMGSSSENSSVAPVRNPRDPERVPGGSSGGSAAAVAANLCTAALGSDTGGSIRQPAAFCGVVGLKPTYGRVSRFGLVAFASSLDQIGPFGRTVEDVARLLNVMAGHDPMDSTSAPEPVPDFTDQLHTRPESLTIGLPVEYLSGDVQPDIVQAIETAKQAFTEAGYQVRDVHLPMTEYCIATYYIICTAEASSNLARYDGARYGHRAADVQNLEEMYRLTRSEGFGKEVKRRIMLGTYVLSAGYYDAYYRRALKVRTLIRRDFEQAFEQCDVLITPTTPSTAFRIGEKTRDPVAMYLSDIFTVSANLAGLPAISIPAGKDENDLPIGVQLLARPFDEATLLRAAAFLEAQF